MGGVGLHAFGVPVDDLADAVFAGFENGDMEIGLRTIPNFTEHGNGGVLKTWGGRL